MESNRKKIAPLIATFELNAIYTSPLHRAVQTAKLVAAETKLPIRKSEGLNEIAFGEWMGRHFDELIDNELYRRFIQSPAKTLLPGGETISDVQRRGLKVIDEESPKVTGVISFRLPRRRYPGDPLPLHKIAAERI